MFNRSLEVKLVKAPKDKSVEDSPEVVVSEDYTKLIQDTVHLVAGHVIVGLGTYVILDTIRQILVKVTPGH